MERFHKLQASLFQAVPVTAVCAARVCLSRKRSIYPTRILPYERSFVGFSRYMLRTLTRAGDDLCLCQGHQVPEVTANPTLQHLPPVSPVTSIAFRRHACSTAALVQ